MSITKQQKKEFIEFFEKQFSETKEFCLASYQGLTVKEMEDLRKKLNAMNAGLYVIKNRLFAKVLQKVSEGGKELESMLNFKEQLEGPVALVIEKGDQIKTIKHLLAYSKTNEKFKVKACFLEGRYLTGNDVLKIAALGSRQETLALLARTIASPLSTFGAVLSAPMRDLVMVLSAAQKNMKQ